MTQRGKWGRQERANKMLAFLTECAAQGRVAPSNDELAEVIDVVWVTTVVGILKQLEARGAVTVQRFINTRIITITATGQSTAAVPVNLSQPRRDRSARGDYQPEHATAPAGRIKRDPCPLCGVRGDIDCSHKRTARPILFVPASFHRAEVAQL